ncbi:MAG: winged helix-turn-helix transcriptional regulator [Armatimonadetes bacterium]|nr:winged helix-turn-helix transcriptional regulator [Anaerolineae bacterium]
MELPYHLQTLEPLTGALDIVRYLGRISAPNADINELCDALNLSERTFGKAIRRLVTKGYVAADGSEQIYRLTRNGREAVDTLAEYDEANPPSTVDKSTESASVTRRLVVALPAMLHSGQPNSVIVGIEGATDEETGVLYTPVDVFVRVSVLHGEPAKPQDAALSLSNYPVRHTFSITPGAFQQMRVRVQVFQTDVYSDDLMVAGGLYVDADITTNATPNTPIAYGSDIDIQVQN